METRGFQSRKHVGRAGSSGEKLLQMRRRAIRSHERDGQFPLRSRIGRSSKSPFFVEGSLPRSALLYRTSFVTAAVAAILAAACGGGAEVTSKPKGHPEAGSAGTGGTTAGTGGGKNTAGTGAVIDPGDGGEGGSGAEPDPCDVPSPPPECFEVGPSGPACGDGEINQTSED